MDVDTGKAPVTARDEPVRGKEGHLSYKIKNGKATITSCDESVCGELVIPDTINGYPVTGIGEYAFGYGGPPYAPQMTSVTIPASVVVIHADAFNYCTSLTRINVSDDNTEFMSEDGVLFNKARTELIRCPEGRSGSYTVPDGVTRIGFSGHAYWEIDYSTARGVVEQAYDRRNMYYSGGPSSCAFTDCERLTSITIPDSVTSIGAQTFARCKSLTGITIPNGVTSIGIFTFSGCWSLKSITIPSSVSWIAENAFYGCGLTNITIPNGVTHISQQAFLYCKDLTSITFEGNAPRLDELYGCIQPIFGSDAAATVYYPAGNDTWTKDMMENCGRNIKWVPYERPTD